MTLWSGLVVSQEEYFNHVHCGKDLAVLQTALLGIILDKKLNFGQHINDLVTSNISNLNLNFATVFIS